MQNAKKVGLVLAVVLALLGVFNVLSFPLAIGIAVIIIALVALL